MTGPIPDPVTADSGAVPAPALRLRARVASRGVELALDVAPGETVALLGPNGAGKSTALGVVAGLVRPDRDHEPSVTLHGRPRDGVAPHARGVALLAQDALLFPHLSVLENVAFAPRSARVPRRQARDSARRHLDAVGAGALAGRRPAELSGGQAQRVAIARALAAEPELLLLDEPMAALDVDVAPALRQTLRDVLAERAAVMVTHDLLDALLLADRVVVLDHGRIVEDGPTAEVLARPRSPFAARLAGHNLLTGRWDGARLRTDHGVLATGTATEQLSAGDPAAALFSPSAVAVATDPGRPRVGAPAPPTGWPVTVTGLEPAGERVRIRAELDGAGLLAEVDPGVAARLAPGARAVFEVAPDDVTIYGSFQSTHVESPGSPGG